MEKTNYPNTPKFMNTVNIVKLKKVAIRRPFLIM